jgi:hypothetical protein
VPPSSPASAAAAANPPASVPARKRGIWGRIFRR